MTIENYLEKVNRRFKSGISREHSYRGDLEELIRELVHGIEVTNEPANVTDCGNPDYVITKGKIPVGYIEAKDIGKDLNSKSYSGQFNRYKKALDNLIITDYIWFQFFQNNELVHEIKIGEIENDQVNPIPENFTKFENLLNDFCTHIGQTIKSPKKLAEMMAAKARLLQDILERAITSDEETKENTSLKGQYDTFKQILIHDLKPKAFADIYAQTLAYGMFAARLHDTSLDNFSRQEAAELIPKSNPFLRKLFGYVAGPDIDERMLRVVDNLAAVFRATNIEQLLKNFGKSTQTSDPIIHFYETFLAEYDPKLRKARGVWYTPEPVVNFIVRAVDEILKTEFNLAQGLADTTKTKIKVKTDIAHKSFKSGYSEVEKEVHKVQILDPATGTGTFLAEVVKFIYRKNFKAMQGAWSGYVEEHLIPRLNGFELLMASYAMAHLKLDMLLTETGYKSSKNDRLNIYLTNSLEEYHADTGTLFSNWLSTEANEANHIKRDTPVMCVIGNPPYSVSSSNKGEWIQNLIKDYKKDLNERNINPLSDDYLKFIRYGQHYIEKNGEGILAYITNNSFVDGIIHRQVRKSLLETFDCIYIIDLHGSTKKIEYDNFGNKDENVFDIRQGVSINLLIKNKNSQQKGVWKYDILGKRKEKYAFLSSSNLNNIKFEKIKAKAPGYFFKKIDYELKKNYEKNLSLKNLFLTNASGFKTERDAFTIQIDSNKIKEIKEDLIQLNEGEIRTKYSLKKDGRDWKVTYAKEDILNNSPEQITVMYRPFDDRETLYTGKSKGFLAYPRSNVSEHLVNRDNLNLLSCRQQSTYDFQHVFVTRKPADMCSVSLQTKETGYQFPLYLYPEQEDGIFKVQKRKPNLNLEIVNKIADQLDLTFVPEPETEGNVCFVNSADLRDDYKTTFAPIDILDYIYAVLHSPTYREKYKEFLKIDFPRVPYPKDASSFWKLVKLGGKIRQLHLLESAKVQEYITSYPIDGDNVITRKITKNSIGYEAKSDTFGRVWINDAQYFDNVPLVAWEFYIGGYQPAQKWLKDRKERTLKFDDILHYQKIIVALSETHRLMQEIDSIEIE